MLVHEYELLSRSVGVAHLGVRRQYCSEKRSGVTYSHVFFGRYSRIFGEKVNVL